MCSTPSISKHTDQGILTNIMYRVIFPNCLALVNIKELVYHINNKVKPGYVLGKSDNAWDFKVSKNLEIEKEIDIYIISKGIFWFLIKYHEQRILNTNTRVLLLSRFLYLWFEAIQWNLKPQLEIKETNMSTEKKRVNHLFSIKYSPPFDILYSMHTK